MLNNITIGQYFPGNSFLHRMDPRAKIIATTIFVVAIFLANSPLAYGIVGGFTIFAMLLSRLPLRLMWSAIKPLWIIIVFTMGIHIFTTPGNPIFQWGIINITDHGVAMGLQMAARLIFLILFSSLLTYTTSPIRLTDGIEHLLNPFRRIGVPAHELAMMMTIALRFIPTLLDETDRIMKAQSARGADFVTGSIIQRAKNMVPLLVPLFISAFRRADELAIAMEARCYRGGVNRTRMKELQVTYVDYIGVGAVVLVTIVLDGTDLAGYQKQPNDKGLTVQGCLEYGLSRICNEPIQIYGASRTDAGVHAKFQVCTFQTSGTISVENIPRAMIAHIPKDIVVIEAIEIPLDWKPRWNIYGKEYVYTIHNQLIADPLTKRYHWHVKKPLDIDRMQAAGNELLGTHDFTTLKGTNSTPADPVKTIMGIRVEARGSQVTISVMVFYIIWSAILQAYL